MPRTCTVCSHPESFAVNEALIIEGKSNRAVACQYGLDREAVRRHKAHIPQLLVKARDRFDRAEAQDLVERVEKLSGVTGAILKEAREGDDKDNELALKAITRLEKQVELEAKILEVIKTQPQINVLLSAEWIQVRTAVIEALEPYPEARMNVVNALSRIEEAAS